VDAVWVYTPLSGPRDPEVPELRTVSGKPVSGGINTEAWFSRLGVGREADNLTL
jgi:hypothetical protein